MRAPGQSHSMAAVPSSRLAHALLAWVMGMQHNFISMAMRGNFRALLTFEYG